MGIVRRQGINSSLLIYLGFAFGAFNILYLFSHYLDLQESGLIFFMVAFSKILASFSMLGNTSIMNKFFPYYNDYLEPSKNDFLFRSFLLPLIGFIALCIVWWLGEPWILRKTVEKSALFSEYYYWMLPFTGLLIIYTVFETYSYTRLKTVTPTLIKELGLRLATAVLVIGFAAGAWKYSTLIKSYSLLYGAMSLALMGILYSHRDLIFSLQLSSVTKRLKSHMLGYGAYVYGGLIIAALAENADTLIIGSVVGLGSVTVYQTAHYISTIIQVPYRSLSAISAPLIAQAWKDKNTAKIHELYEKTSLTQLLAGLLLFGMIWVNIDFILSFLGEDYAGVKEIVLLLGISRLIDLGFGQNAEILHNSKHWKFNFLSYVILVVLFLPLNYFLVKELGIIGSGIANLISFFMFNIVRYIFLYRKFRMQPFNVRTLGALLFSGLAYALVEVIGFNIGGTYVSLILRSFSYAGLFAILVLAFRLSREVNGLIPVLLGYIKRK